MRIAHFGLFLEKYLIISGESYLTREPAVLVWTLTDLHPQGWLQGVVNMRRTCHVYTDVRYPAEQTEH